MPQHAHIAVACVARAHVAPQGTRCDPSPAHGTLDLSPQRGGDYALRTIEYVPPHMVTDSWCKRPLSRGDIQEVAPVNDLFSGAIALIDVIFPTPSRTAMKDLPTLTADRTVF